ncbi:MAG: hypothetical protein NC200_07355 [Candidatus Gastranaerophilales bacterium]|nr:hypothetical protein [Candidatus Gastranaerophilales bacterium]
MFKRVLLVIACLFVMVSNQVSAANVRNFSDDEQIRAALTLLNNIGAEDVFDNLQENSVKIKFYDLSQLSYEYKNHFATNSTDVWGNRYILINTKYKNAPTEQIACLIAHESCHKGSVATLEEETTATRKEAQYWTILKKHNVAYVDSALLQRLESLKNLESSTTVSHDYIQERISNSSFYQNQLAVRDRRKF